MDKLSKALQNYSVVILAAGTGSRMGKLGKIKPKALFEIKNETILKNIIKKLQLRGLKEINIILGFKYKLILKEIRNIKNLKFFYIKMKDFINTGSVYSFYKFKDIWLKFKRKPIIMLHADIFFDIKYLDNLLLSNKENLIGVKKETKQKLKKNSFVLEHDDKLRVKKIDLYKKSNNSNQQIICINKFSAKFYLEFLVFLKQYFKKNSKNITWEYPLSEFLTKKKTYIIQNQKFSWFNINTLQDLNNAKKFIK